MTKRWVIVAALVGAALGLVHNEVQELKSRVERVERRSVSTAGGPTQPDYVREMQRRSARDFVDVLREEKLVITTAPPVDGSDAE